MSSLFAPSRAHFLVEHALRRRREAGPVVETWRPPDSQLPRAMEKPGIHQQFMNQAYKDYEAKAGRQKVSRALSDQPPISGHQNFLISLSEAERFAVVFGNLNYQVENGGFSQWIGNRYYVDTIEYLREYIAKYGKQYQAIGQVGLILDEVEGMAESFGGGKFDLENLDKVLDAVNDAVNEEAWDDLDELLGGTDYDKRRFDNSVESTIKDGFSINVEEVEQGQFAYQIELFDDRIETSEPVYSDEDTAYEAADARADELRDVIIREGNESYDKAVDLVKDEFCAEIGKFLERDMGHMYDRLEDDYSKLSPQLLEQVGSVLRLDFSVSGDIRKFITQAVEKAKAVLSHVKSGEIFREPVKRLRTGAANMLANVAKGIRPESSSSDVINRLLG